MAWHSLVTRSVIAVIASFGYWSMGPACSTVQCTHGAGTGVSPGRWVIARYGSTSASCTVASSNIRCQCRSARPAGHGWVRDSTAAKKSPMYGPVTAALRQESAASGG